MENKKPAYIRYPYNESEITVDYYFGKSNTKTKITQTFCIIIGWIMAILPLSITIYKLTSEKNNNKLWPYSNELSLLNSALSFFEYFFFAFIILFLLLFLLNLVKRRKKASNITYDVNLSSSKSMLIEDLYESKYGPYELRAKQSNVEIDFYNEIQTYEIRNLYGRL